MSFQNDVGIWGGETFPQGTVTTILAHLRDEVDELEDALMHPASYTSMSANREMLAGEMADVYLLLLHLAHRTGVDLEMAAAEKFDINKQRTWTTDSGRGYVKHDEVTR